MHIKKNPFNWGTYNNKNDNDEETIRAYTNNIVYFNFNW